MRRRSVLAVLATGLAGCAIPRLDSDGTGIDTTRDPSATATARRGGTATGTRRSTDDSEPLVGPEPLGYEAVPPGSADPPAFDRERVLAADEGLDAAALAPGRSEHTGLLASPAGTRTPVLVRIDQTGRERGRTALVDVPTTRAFLLERVGETAVVGGLDREDRPETWLQGIRDGDVVYTFTRTGTTTYSALSVVDGTLVAAGNTGWTGSGDPQFDAVLTHLGADGRVDGELIPDTTAANTRFWAVTPTPDGLLAGGSHDGDVWLVSFDTDGTVQWRQAVPRRDAYVVHRLAVGETGTYALAATNQFAQGNNHLMLLSFADGVDVEWVRVFDPNVGKPVDQPRELHPAGLFDVDGPVVVGRTDRRPWLAATDPDGSVQWAGYAPHDERVVRPVGAVRVDDHLLLHGSRGSSADGTAPLRPWLAWLPVG